MTGEPRTPEDLDRETRASEAALEKQIDEAMGRLNSGLRRDVLALRNDSTMTDTAKLTTFRTLVIGNERSRLTPLLEAAVNSGRTMPDRQALESMLSGDETPLALDTAQGGDQRQRAIRLGQLEPVLTRIFQAAGLGDLELQTNDDLKHALAELLPIIDKGRGDAPQPTPPASLDPAPVPFDPNTSWGSPLPARSDSDIEQTHLSREELKTFLQNWDREIGDSEHTLKHSLRTSGVKRDERQNADTRHWQELRSMTKPPELPWRPRS